MQKQSKTIETNVKEQTFLLAPSLLAADFSTLEKEMKNIEEETDWWHLDVMDGHFVPNISFGFPVIESLRKVSTKVFDCHLMIEKPSRFYSVLAKIPVEVVTVHVEACPHLHRDIQEIKKLGMKAGVALNPSTPLCLIEEILPLLDLVLLMTVNPGFGGQKFIQEVLPKLRKLATWKKERKLSFYIEVDGGVTEETLPRLQEAGAEVFVAGSAVFRAPQSKEALKNLRKLSQQKE